MGEYVRQVVIDPCFIFSPKMKFLDPKGEMLEGHG